MAICVSFGCLFWISIYEFAQMDGRNQQSGQSLLFLRLKCSHMFSNVSGWTISPFDKCSCAFCPLLTLVHVNQGAGCDNSDKGNLPSKMDLPWNLLKAYQGELCVSVLGAMSPSLQPLLKNRQTPALRQMYPLWIFNTSNPVFLIDVKCIEDVSLMN